jgi:hypothetical protein
MSEQEIWKSVEGFEGAYEVSNLGRARRIYNVKYQIEPKIKYLSTTWGKNQAYVKTTFYRKGHAVNRDLHIVILETFIGPRPSIRHHASHLNGNMHDNRLDNLQWCTAKDNMSHKKIHGTQQVGENNPFAKLTENEVMAMRIMHFCGSRAVDISNTFGVDQGLVGLIIKRKRWKHLPKVREYLGNALKANDT